MSSSLVCLALSLPAVGVPAPKIGGIPAEIIDRLPIDTATVLVVDVPRVSRSPIGRHFFSRLHPHLEEWLPLETAAKEVEYVVIAQYAIESFAGDFCILLRLDERAELPGRIIQMCKGNTLKIGPHTVYRLRQGSFFARLDKNTAAIVLLTGNAATDEALARELGAVFGEAKKGPNEALRRKLVDFRPDSAVALVSEHPKSGLSATLSLAPFGYQSLNLQDIADKIHRYSGSVAFGDKTANMELRLEAKNADAAMELRDRLERERAGDASSEWIKSLQKDMTITRDRLHVTLKGRLNRDIIDAMFGRD
jgi:hypothetical protein